jgi:putative DNA primase/helicase
MKEVLKENSDEIVAIVEKLSTNDVIFGEPDTLRVLEAFLLSKDAIKSEEVEEIIETLIDEEYVVLDGEGMDATFEKISIEQLKEDLNYIEHFVPHPDSEKGQEKITDFAEWIARDKELVKTVKLGPEKESKEIWAYNREELVWNKEGENRIAEKLYEDMPEIHTSHYEKEAANKVKKIEPIKIESTGPEKGNIAVSNGILDLSSGELRKLKKKDYVLNKLPVEYKAEVESPVTFLKFLEDVVSSQENINKIQEFLGYCLMTQTAKYEKALMILGPTDSGKSVFLNVVRSLLGENNIAQESLQNLTNGRQWGLANIVDKIANIDHDLDAEKLNDIGTAKKVISGNPMSIEEKYKQPYEYAPTAKHLFSANKTPPRDKEDDAFYNRWLTVTFPHTVPPEDQDPNLTDKLTDQEELQRILKWAVKGAQRLEDNQGFTGEKGPEETKMIWRQWGNSIDRFIAKFLETRPQLKKKEEHSEEDVEEMTLKTHTGTIYNLYEKYASGTDMEVKSKKALSSEIKNLPGVESGQPTIMGDSRRGYKGVKIVDNSHQKIEEEIERYQNSKY